MECDAQVLDSLDGWLTGCAEKFDERIDVFRVVIERGRRERHDGVARTKPVERFVVIGILIAVFVRLVEHDK